jgi:hypothetical protein
MLIIGKKMENKLFNLLCQLETVHKLLEHDASDLTLCGGREKIQKIQEEIDVLSVKEVELYNAMRKELFAAPQKVETEKKPINKKEGKRERLILDKK